MLGKVNGFKNEEGLEQRNAVERKSMIGMSMRTYIRMWRKGNRMGSTILNTLVQTNTGLQKPGGRANLALNIWVTGVFINHRGYERERKGRFIVKLGRNFERCFR